MTQETERLTIVDPDNANNVISVVESTDVPGVYGIVLLNPDGTNIGS